MIIKNILEFKIIAILQVNAGVLHKAHAIKIILHLKICIVVHNGSSCDYHFIIKDLANKFEGKFGCLWENQEKLFQIYEKFMIQKRIIIS